jgi:hypothetical protein
VAEHLFAGLRCPDVADLAPAFVLGALEPVEADAVRRHLGECPEPHPEIAELYSVVPALLASVEPVEPPASLKGRVLAAASAEQAARAVSAPRPAPAPERTPAPSVRRGWADLFRRPVWAAASLAAVLVVAALGAWNLQLQGELAALSAYRDGVVQVLDAAARPGTQLAVLVPPEGSGPSGLAAVSADGKVALAVRDLTPTSGTEVYEAWLIGSDGTPVAIGGFTVRADGTGSLVISHGPVEDGVTVALTREPQRDATTPTLPIVVAGQAHSQAS